MKYHFIKQIPNLIKQKALTARQNVATVIENVKKGQMVAPGAMLNAVEKRNLLSRRDYSLEI